MNQAPLISVIVPVYNVEEYLPRCVDSILAQTYENLEIILVDDGTRDASDKICDDYARRDSRIQVIHKKNGGLSSARNAGLEIARGEYIAFVDSDDWIEPDAYEHMLAVMQRQAVKLVCAGRYDVSSATGKKTKGLCPPKEERISAEEMIGRIFLWDGCDSAAWDKLYHRSLLEDFRYPVGKICEDVPVTYRIVLQAGQVAMCDRPIYNYFHRPGSITTASVSEKTFHLTQHTAEIYPFIQKNHPAIAPQARYFHVHALAYELLRLDTASEEDRQRFAKQYALSRKALGAHFFFILRSPYFGRQERLTDLLLTLGLYRRLRPLYHKLKSE